MQWEENHRVLYPGSQVKKMGSESHWLQVSAAGVPGRASEGRGLTPGFDNMDMTGNLKQRAAWWKKGQKPG